MLEGAWEPADPASFGVRQPRKTAIMSIFHRLPSQSALTVDVVFARVNANHGRLAKKVDRKQAGERDYYARRYGFEGGDTEAKLEGR